MAEIVGCPIERTPRISEVFGEGWAIGGVQASELRKAEIEARAEQPNGSHLLGSALERR